MIRKYAKEIKLALTVICAIVLIFYGINYLKGINIFQHYSTYHVRFHDVTGLEESNAVYVNGYPIGTVRKIDYDYARPGNIKVEIEVDDDMKFPQGSYAEIKSGLLGGTTLNVVLGDGDKYLSPGEEFAGAPEVGLMDKFKDMSPSIEAMVPKLDSIITNLNIILNNPSIGRTLDNAEYITSNLRTTTDCLNELLSKDIPSLMARMNHIGENAETVTDRLKNIDYENTIDNVNKTLSQVNSLTTSLEDKINSKEGTLGLMLNDPKLYTNLNNALESSDALLKDLKTHPKRYVHFSIFGRKDK